MRKELEAAKLLSEQTNKKEILIDREAVPEVVLQPNIVFVDIKNDPSKENATSLAGNVAA